MISDASINAYSGNNHEYAGTPTHKNIDHCIIYNREKLKPPIWSAITNYLRNYSLSTPWVLWYLFKWSWKIPVTCKKKKPILYQKSANYGHGVNPAHHLFLWIVLLAHSHTLSFSSRLRLALFYGCRAEWLWPLMASEAGSTYNLAFYRKGYWPLFCIISDKIVLFQREKEKENSQSKHTEMKNSGYPEW